MNLERLKAACSDGYDLVVLVNPNSPTGQFIPREKLEALLRSVPAKTRVWVDETYIEYAGTKESMERFAAGSENVIVCKSMSKVYALSGARVAYLCGGAHQIGAIACGDTALGGKPTGASGSGASFTRPSVLCFEICGDRKVTKPFVSVLV